MLQALAIPQDGRARSLAPVVDALGTSGFEMETMRLLNAMTGAEHYSVYRMRDGHAKFLGGGSIRGRHAMHSTLKSNRWPQRTFVELHRAGEFARGCANAVVLHPGIEEIDDPALDSALKYFQIADRVMVCGRSIDDVYALALLRSSGAGQFDEEALRELAASADVLISACAKHASLHWDNTRALVQFKSVEVIEGNIRTANWGISERELQVSARILFGISACGIALDLGLGEETIATYRKRLYARLKIAGRHEWLQRYLSLF